MISKRPIFGSGKVSFTLFLRQRRGEGQLLITSQLCCYLKKKRLIKRRSYVIIVIAFVPVHAYSLKFGEKITIERRLLSVII